MSLFNKTPLETTETEAMEQLGWEPKLFNVPINVERTQEGIMLIGVMARSQSEAEARVVATQHLIPVEVYDWDTVDLQVIGIHPGHEYWDTKAYSADMRAEDFATYENIAFLSAPHTEDPDAVT